jgi:CRISPR-associated endonuclease/helicase Cas3
MPNFPDWLRDLARSLASDRRRRGTEAGGVYAIVGRRGSGEDLSTADDGSSLGVAISLADHSTGVRDYAERFARAAGLPEPLVADIALAAWVHDVGKADPRFQVWLHDGDEVAAALAGAVLAKSGQNPRNRAAIRRARERVGYPQGGRHEAQSLALIADQTQIREQAHDWDLVQHLVVSHHGFGRPFVPVVPDPGPVLVTLEHGPLRLSHRTDHSLHRIDSGIAERYWRLLRRYGWWGLAWLEAILRLADHRRSEEEERKEANNG